MHNQKNFTLRILPEILFSLPLAMYFPKNHYLAEIIDKKVKLLHSAGLLDFWTSSYLKQLNKDISSPGPSMLTIEQLAGSFYILLGGLTLGTFVFIVELSVHVFKERPRVKI